MEASFRLFNITCTAILDFGLWFRFPPSHRPMEFTYQFSVICICQNRCGKISFFIIHYFPNRNLSTISVNHALSKSKILLRIDPLCLLQTKSKDRYCCSGARFGNLLKWRLGGWEDRWVGFPFAVVELRAAASFTKNLLCLPVFTPGKGHALRDNWF